MTSNNKPLTCKLTTPELQNRKATVIAGLKSLLKNKVELDNGFSYTFESSDQNLDRINDFIKTERLCCDFFNFQLTVDQELAILNVTGPSGAKEFLQKEVEF